MYLKDVITNLKLKKIYYNWIANGKNQERKNKEEERQRKKGGKNGFRED